MALSQAALVRRLQELIAAPERGVPPQDGTHEAPTAREAAELTVEATRRSPEDEGEERLSS